MNVWVACVACKTCCPVLPNIHSLSLSCQISQYEIKIAMQLQRIRTSNLLIVGKRSISTSLVETPFPYNLKISSSKHIIAFFQKFFTLLPQHGRRVNTEEKSKIVAAVWQTEFIRLLAELDILRSRMIFEEQDEFFLFFKSSWCNSSYSSNPSSAKQLARQGIEYIQSPKQQRRPLPFLLYLSFFMLPSYSILMVEQLLKIRRGVDILFQALRWQNTSTHLNSVSEVKSVFTSLYICMYCT